jgi:SAM-dependent methyltransferase
MNDGRRESVATVRNVELSAAAGTEELTRQIIVDFGRQWTRYRDNSGYYGSLGLLTDIIEPLLPVGAIAGARIAEIGSGSGRIVNMLLDAGAAHVIAVEPSEAMQVLRANTASRAERITYIHARGEALPPDADQDIVVAIGVLHHIPKPGAVVDAAMAALRPGGIMFVWLCGREGNEDYLRFVRPLRVVTTRLPPWSLSALSHAMNVALDLYIVLAKWLPVPMRDYVRHMIAHLPRRARHLTIYDQLNPAYAKYYTREEAIALLAGAGFVDVAAHHRHGYSWSVIGRRVADGQA